MKGTIVKCLLLDRCEELISRAVVAACSSDSIGFYDLRSSLNSLLDECYYLEIFDDEVVSSYRERLVGCEGLLS